MSDADSTRGRLLVATPDLVDPNFFRTVLLMLEHDDQGALGVVLNRPSEAHLDEVLPTWRRVATEPSVAFVGGPVASDSVIAVARSGRAEDAEGWAPVFADLGTVDLSLAPEDIDAELSAVRVFAGYAGWTAGQLDGEIARGGWFVFDVAPDDPFTRQPEALWTTVLRRQGGFTALFANCPADPSVN